MDIKNNTFVVTGAGNGIGREVVLGLLSRGAKVAGLDISEDGMKETAALAGGNAKNLTVYNCDITRLDRVQSVADEILKKHKRINGLLNVAGVIQPFVRVNDLTFAKMEWVMNVNYYGTLYTIKTFLPHLLASESTAYIGNVSSMGGFLPVPGQSVYGASKAAVKLLTEGLYAELLETNVRVGVIFPGAVATNITENSGVELKNINKENAPQRESLAPEKAAEIIIDGIITEKFRVLVGADAEYMDKMYREDPESAVKLIAAQMKDLLQ
jgi:short-subunit dehydrogenase